MKKVYFTVKSGERLGNWMFQYAAAKSLSDDVACIVETPKLIEQMRKTPWFRALECRMDAPEGTAIYREKRFRFDSLPRMDKDLVIEGYFQSGKYLDRRKVQQLFAIPEDVKKEIEVICEEAFQDPNVASISVRRGDYLLHPHQFPFVGKGYLRAAIRCFPRTRNFIVCSDDMEWCRKFFTEKQFPGKRFFLQTRGPMLDLLIPSFCANNILSNSSFSWWGAFLNARSGQRIVAPSRWFGWDYKRKGLDWTDIYIDGTEILNNDYTLWQFI